MDKKRERWKRVKKKSSPSVSKYEKENKKHQKGLVFFSKLIQQSFGFVKKIVLEFLLSSLYAIFLSFFL